MYKLDSDLHFKLDLFLRTQVQSTVANQTYCAGKYNILDFFTTSYSKNTLIFPNT